MTRGELKALGEKMGSWHSSIRDPIYAVVSCFRSGIDPDLKFVHAALARHKSALAHPDRSWGPEEIAELEAIVRDLKGYIADREAPKMVVGVKVYEAERKSWEHSTEDRWHRLHGLHITGKEKFLGYHELHGERVMVFVASDDPRSVWAQRV